MIYRVNLIRESELRYQGAVSRSFMFKAGGITVGGLLGIFLLFSFLQYRTVRQNLSWAREQWAQISPIYNNVVAMQQDLAANQKILTELKSWNNSRVAWSQPLVEIREIVPLTIQLTRLNIIGSVELKEIKLPPPPAATAGDKKSPTEKKAEKAKPPALMFRRFNISMEGKASGELADEVVVQFVKTMSESPSFKPMLESIKLRGLRREDEGAASASRDQPQASDRLFGIEATTLPKEIK